MEIGPEDEPDQPPAVTEGVTGADGGTDGGAQLREAQSLLKKAQARNEALAREVGELTVKLMPELKSFGQISVPCL